MQLSVKYRRFINIIFFIFYAENLCMKAIKFFSCLICLFNLFFLCYAQEFVISINDVRIETDYSDAGEITGYHLYVKKLPEINSVLLTETTKDPLGQEDNYAYRASEWNAINGDEIRMLNGKKLESEYAKFSIIDSTPQSDAIFGSAFHLYIPTELIYGYPWSRNGVVKVGKGTFINIRSFGAKYADYSAGFTDNPFMFDLAEPIKKSVQKEIPVKKEVIITDSYNPVAAYNFESVAKISDGQIIYSKGPETIIEDIMQSLETLDLTRPIDIVFAIDATGSMKDDIQQLRLNLMEKLDSLVAKAKDNLRFGLLLYRDYVDSFRYRELPVRLFDFSQNVQTFEKALNSFNIYGTEGGDVPEAVYEALFASMEYYQWNSVAQKKIILIGDAEAHPRPRGTKKYTKELIEEMAKTKGIKIDAIITPDGKNRGEK